MINDYKALCRYVGKAGADKIAQLVSSGMLLLCCDLDNVTIDTNSILKKYWLPDSFWRKYIDEESLNGSDFMSPGEIGIPKWGRIPYILNACRLIPKLTTTMENMRETVTIEGITETAKMIEKKKKIVVVFLTNRFGFIRRETAKQLAIAGFGDHVILHLRHKATKPDVLAAIGEMAIGLIDDKLSNHGNSKRFLWVLYDPTGKKEYPEHVVRISQMSELPLLIEKFIAQR